MTRCASATPHSKYCKSAHTVQLLVKHLYFSFRRGTRNHAYRNTRHQTAPEFCGAVWTTKGPPPGLATDSITVMNANDLVSSRRPPEPLNGLYCVKGRKPSAMVRTNIACFCPRIHVFFLFFSSCFLRGFFLFHTFQWIVVACGKDEHQKKTTSSAYRFRCLACLVCTSLFFLAPGRFACMNRGSLWSINQGNIEFSVQWDWIRPLRDNTWFTSVLNSFI